MPDSGSSRNPQGAWKVPIAPPCICSGIAGIQSATRGNNPDTYLKLVAGELKEDPEKVRNKPLSAMDLTKVAAAIKNKVEKWVVGTELPIDQAIDDTSLPTETRFRLLYTKWSSQK